MAAAELIKTFEGCRLTAYKCPAGKDTIGYGHTGPDVQPGMVISQEEADRLLDADIKRVSCAIARLLRRPLSASQMAALISFVFNVGEEAFRKSTLLDVINKGFDDTAALEFLKWTKAGGQTMQGLVRRRVAESAKYRSGSLESIA